MDLERRRIVIRPRSQWEACDLGIQMGRNWWWPLVKIQALLALPWALACWLMPEGYTLLPVALFWVGKPICERFLLHFLSLAIFDNQLSLRQVFAATRQILALECLASITWRRLSPWRSYHSAITVLEKQKGRNRRQRLEHLNCDHATAAAMLTLLLFCMEWAALVSLWLIAYALMPNQWTDQFLGLKDLLGTRTFTSLGTSFYFLVNIAITPFYVAAGFALYLNRRVWLEAWDIDINFKAIVQKLGSTVLLLLCCLIWQVHQPAPAYAETSTPQTLHYLKAQDHIGRALKNLAHPERLFPELIPRQEISARFPAEQWRIQDIFASADFHHKKMQLTHRLRWEFSPRKPKDLSGWQEFFDSAARILEILLWCLVVLLIFWLVINYRSLSLRFGINKKNILISQTPQSVFGLDIRPQSLPESVDELALNYCQTGQMRQGLSLLYRATLVALVNQGLVIKASDTEGDCVGLLKNGRLQLADENIAFFQQLTHYWQGLAYGHQLPPLQQVELLCRNWRALWQAGAQHD